MKKILTAILAVVALSASQPAQAQFSWGLTGGVNITDMKFSGEALSKDNRSGFFIGPKVKFTVPVVGLALDASVVYDQRSFKGATTNGTDVVDETVKQQYINVPINVRYSLGLGSVASVHAAVGPQFGFNVGDKNWSLGSIINPTDNSPLNLGGYSLKSSNLSLNFSVGATLLKHIEVYGRYNMALGKTGEYSLSQILNSASTATTQLAKEVVTGNLKSNSWQIGVAYYF